MADGGPGWLANAFSYTTVKVVKIYNWKLGLVHHSIQLLIILYIVGFVLFVESGYQSQSPVIGYTASKVKGSATQLVPGTNNETVWDATDVVVPPLEPNAVFITTNTINTYGQYRGEWVDPTVSPTSCAAACSGSLDYGFYIGCQNNTCYYQGWGPYPSDTTLPGNILQQVQSWTVFVRCFALFSDYNIRVDNLGNQTGPNNLFTISNMLQGAGTNFSAVSNLGTVISMNIDWTCSFDFWSHACNPKFSYTRLDDPDQSFSNGFNFRYANYYSYPDENGNIVQYRDLIKAYGIRFSFLITGIGRKFSIVPLLLNIGSGLGLLVVATVICDLLALYVFPQKRKYEKAKFKDIRAGDSVNYSTDFPDETTDIINNASKARLY